MAGVSRVLLMESSPRCLRGMAALCKNNKLTASTIKDEKTTDVRWVRYHDDEHSKPHSLVTVLGEVAAMQPKLRLVMIAAPFINGAQVVSIKKHLDTLRKNNCALVWTGSSATMEGTVSPKQIVRDDEFTDLPDYNPETVSELSRQPWAKMDLDQKTKAFLAYRMQQLYMWADQPAAILRDTLAQLLENSGNNNTFCYTLPAMKQEPGAVNGRVTAQKTEFLVQRYCEKGYPAIAGRTKVSDAFKMQIRDLALLDMNILLTGETGTGKELAAYFIHELGPRRTKPYFELNCAGLDEKIAESALFGHVKGAFTGADSKKEALVAMADNGTLFLDELPSLCRSVQEKLLRFLESGEYLPVGSTVKQQANCRIIAGGQPGRIDERLNRDLYYRLAETTLNLPSLHAYDPIDRIIVARNRADFMQGKTRVERDEHSMATVRLINQQDINHFWQEIDQNAALIHSYSWPGNVRELYAMIKQSLCLSRPLKELLEEVLQQEQKKNNPELAHDATPLPELLEEANLAACPKQLIVATGACPLPMTMNTPEEVITIDELKHRYVDWAYSKYKQWNLNQKKLAELLGYGSENTMKKDKDWTKSGTLANTP